VWSSRLLGCFTLLTVLEGPVVRRSRRGIKVIEMLDDAIGGKA